MRRYVLALVIAATGCFLIAPSGRGQAQVGPEGGGAVLKDPFAPGALKPADTPPANTSYVERLLQKKAMGSSGSDLPALNLSSLAPSDGVNINKDIEVTSNLGPYMILIQTYESGPDQPRDECYRQARQLVVELRSTYKLNAYTFNKGTEEREREYERVKKAVAEKRELYRKAGLPEDFPVRVKVMHIQEQCAVLVGGYPSLAAACSALKELGKLKPPDPDKVALSVRFYAKQDKSKIEEIGMGLVNPFKAAFVVPNPTIKQEQPTEANKLDIGLLRKLNAGENLSLLQCKKPITLAIKQFMTPHEVETRDAPSKNLLASMWPGKKMERIDAAATSAHDYAEWLRKGKLDAFVLHTKYSSVVTVGAFDSVEDPAFRSMVNLIENNRQKLIPPLPAGSDPRAFELFAKPMPMQVPR